MDSIEIPETVILEMQSAAYRLKKDMTSMLERVVFAEKELNRTIKDRAIKAKNLREILDFLQQHNPDAVRDEDWFGEIGYDRDNLLEIENWETKENNYERRDQKATS